MSRSGVAARFRQVVDNGSAEWPLPGGGQTWERFTALGQIAGDDLSVARLVEAHIDALAICAEASRSDIAEGALAVWASEGPVSRVEATPVAGGWRLVGTKQFCTGSTIVDQALITTHAPDGQRLFMIPLNRAGVHLETAGWVATAFAATATGTMHIAAEVPEPAAIGAPDFYLTRPGFWHGAVSVAACWAGGARGLVDRYLVRHARDDAHSLAHRGAMEAVCWGMAAALRRAAGEIDADPLNVGGDAMSRALAARHVVERACLDVLDRLGRAAGPRPAAFDGWFIQQSADLTLYLKQCHGERDLEALGRAWPASPRSREHPCGPRGFHTLGYGNSCPPQTRDTDGAPRTLPARAVP
jgi:hypothetical protein